MSGRRYSVKEVFATLQGEGANAGRFAVFVRFAGCNLWNGREGSRAEAVERTGAPCPAWCDTDFAVGSKYDSKELAAAVVAAAGGRAREGLLVVFTGGEPLLQLDEELAYAVCDAFVSRVEIAVETNGTVPLPAGLVRLDWICVSPKVPQRDVKLSHFDEVKVVFPAFDPGEYARMASRCKHAWVSPEAATSSVGVSRVVDENTRAAAAYCMRNPPWKLSLQTHKIVGLP